MKITKRQLRKIIGKEYSHRLNEQYDSSIETGSGLIDFAKAYASLGHAVQEQVDQLVSAYFNGGGPDSEAFEEAVYEVNPNAVDLAWNRLSRPARMAGDEGEDIMHALDVAKEMFDRETIEESGMPSSVSKHKQTLAQMTDEEFAAQHGAKSEEALRQMAWRHGYGKMSSYYWDRVERVKEKGVDIHEGMSPEHMPDAWRQVLGDCLGKETNEDH